MRAKFLDPLARSRTNPELAPMSRAGLQHALARVLEGKEIRLKNNKLPLQPRCIERFTIPRVKTHWPVIFAITLIVALRWALSVMIP